MDDVPTPAVVPVRPPPPALDNLNTWKSNMLSYGQQYCTAAQMAMPEQNVWYYDGIRNYMQIANRTEDPYWTACVDMNVALYRQYVTDNQAGVPGWRVFPHGLGMHYLKTGEAASKTAVGYLAAANTIRFKNRVPWLNPLLSREIAFAVNTCLVSDQLGFASRPECADYVEILFGHFDQWFVTKNAPYVQPFMVALSAEALIDYWYVTKDPRVLPTLKKAADELWANEWDSTAKAFPLYEEKVTGLSSEPAPDLNLLICPLYGWVNKYTGDAGYREKGDQMFNRGVTNGYLGSGKHFSQQYRWSAKYVEWRTPALAIFQER